MNLLQRGVARLDAISARVRLETLLPELTDPRWSRRRSSLLTLGLIGMMLVGLSLRWSQEQVMRQSPEIFSVGTKRLSTTPDSGYFLQAALRYAEAGEVGRFDTQGFPNTLTGDRGAIAPVWTDYLQPRAGTLLPILLAEISRQFEITLEQSASVLLAVSVVLTGVVTFTFFSLMGTPFAGVVAAGGAMFAWPVYARTSVGMVDTDLLNLFFFFATLSAIHMASVSKTSRRVWGWSATAGLLNFLFFLWYGKPPFTVFFGGALLLSGLIRGIRFRDLSIGTLIFLICSGPEQVLSIPGAIIGFESMYVGNLRDWASPAMTAIRETISEARTPSLAHLRFGYGSLLVYGLAVAGALLWTLQDWKRLPYIGILIVFFALVFRSGLRFDYYVAPMLWAGFATLMGACAAQLLRRFALRASRSPTPRGMAIAASGAAVFTALGLSAAVPTRGLVPSPDVPPQDLHLLQQTLARENPEPDPIILTDWSFGYFVAYHTRLPTIHDGGSMISLKTVYFSRALVQTDPSLALRDLQTATYFDEYSLRKWYPNPPPWTEAVQTNRDAWLFLPTRSWLAWNSITLVAAATASEHVGSAPREAGLLRDKPATAFRVLAGDGPEFWGRLERLAEDRRGARIYRVPSPDSLTRRNGEP